MSDDHDLLIRMDEKLDALSRELSIHVAHSEVVHEQQGTRISVLEVWRWKWAGALAIIVFLVTIVGNVAARHLW